MSKIEVKITHYNLGTCETCGDSSDPWEYTICVDGEASATYGGGGCLGGCLDEEVLMARVLKALGHTLEVTSLDPEGGEPVCSTTYD
jgi:hypothetical protein